MGSDVKDATTIGRFCQQLVEHGLWDILLGEVNRQLEEKHIIIPVNAHDSTERDTLLLRIPRRPHAVSWTGLALMIKCSAKDIGATLFQTLTGCETTQSL